MALKNAAKYLGGLVLAAALLGWVLRGTDPEAVWRHLQSIPRGQLIAGLCLAAALNLAHNVFRVYRWRALLSPVRESIRFRPMFDAVILGYMVTWIVPGRLGELVRPALLAGRERLPLGPCLGSILADRVLDGTAVLAMFAVGVAITPLTGASAGEAELVRNATLGLVGLIFVPLIVLRLAASRRESLLAFAGRRSGPLAWCLRTLVAFARGTEALARPGLLLRALGHTLGAWALIVIATWLGIRACGAAISPGGVMVLMPLLALGIALPTPGGAGGYHLAMKVGLVNLFAVAEPAALAAGFLMHLVIVVPIVLWGAVLLIVDRIPLRELLDAARQVRSMGESDDAGAAVAHSMERVP